MLQIRCCWHRNKGKHERRHRQSEGGEILILDPYTDIPNGAEFAQLAEVNTLKQKQH